MAELNKTKDNPKVDKEDIFGSESFFDNLENDVNGMVQDQPNDGKTTEVTQSDSGTEQVTHDNSQNGSDVDWQKRYKDSSSEAVKMAKELRDLRPFVPVLEAMKRDSGLVEHVRGYLTNGGKPAKTVQEKLGLSEDFMFDQHEAMTDPDSDSAKLMNAHVDGLVQQRVQDTLGREKQKSKKFQALIERKRQEAEFKKKHDMSEDQFKEFVDASKQHRLTLEDIYFLVNKDKAAANAADATKKDMLSQMKSVRDIPMSAGDSNSEPAVNNPDEVIFDALAGLDGDLDDLFGDK